MSSFWLIIGRMTGATVAAAALLVNVAGDQVTVASARAQQAAPENREIVYGQADAPVTVVEYASLTCGHCADFHQNVLPEIKSRLIDTGKIRLVFRDFPLDQLALRAAVLVRCAAPERRKPMLDVLFSTQQTWAGAPDPVEALNRIGRSAGMDDQALEACYNNQPVIDGVLADRLEGEQKYQVNSTPSFVIDGEMYRGGMSAEQMALVVESLIP